MASNHKTSSSSDKHYTQRTHHGTASERHARVLLAQTPTDLEAAYDDWAADYDTDLATICGTQENTPGWTAGKVLVERFPLQEQQPLVLDFGCGTGPAAVLFHQHGLSTHTRLDGCDLSSGMLAQAEQRQLYRSLIKADVTSCNCASDCYDMVHASAVFAPAQAPPSALDEFWRVLKVGGHAIFTVRCEYYDQDEEGAELRRHLDHGISVSKQWQLVSQTRHPYLPNDGVMAYVFVLKKLGP